MVLYVIAGNTQCPSPLKFTIVQIIQNVFAITTVVTEERVVVPTARSNPHVLCV